MFKRIYSIKNGKKGGRPSSENYVKVISVPEAGAVILTEGQYNTLINKYGSALIQKALEILDKWLNSSPIAIKYKGKNNYALFRSDGWVINYAKEQLD